MRFQEAANFTRTSGRQIDLIVIHDMEAGEFKDTAENIASWFAGSNAPRASAHYNIDVDSIVQSVRDKDVAWHAPGANSDGIGLEHAGYARQTAAEWRDSYSTRMLRDQSAPLCRRLCDQYDIPVTFVGVAGLLRGERGVTTHDAVSKAFKRSTHWDPGPHFPMSWYLEQVRKSKGGSPGDNVAIDTGARLLKHGVQGEDVAVWQRLIGVADDGIFGPNTEAATMEMQRKLNVDADGVVGPQTRAAMGRLLAYLAAQSRPKEQTPPAYPGRLIRRGDRGGIVSTVQQQLRDNASQDITVDGDFGPNTEEAVENVQRFFKLDVDGIVGPDTWGTLWL